MKSVTGSLIVALALFAVGAVAWSQARLTRQVAAAHQRLATLHYDDVVVDTSSVLNRLTVPGGPQDDLEVHGAAVNYWLARYEALKSVTGATGNQPSTDANVLLIAANGAFRTSHPEVGDHKLAVERLDGVLQGYADVLRTNPDNDDAAYNYEYVSRLRDVLAKGKALPKPAAPRADDLSVDLPAGPTLHGRPGNPPDTIPMSDFKTVSPMRFDEREEQAEPGKGKPPQRKG